MPEFQRVRRLFALLPLSALIGCIHRPPLTPYTGVWVLSASRTGDDVNNTHPIMAMQMRVLHRKLQGELVRPSHYTEEADGSFNQLELPLKTSVIDGERFNHPLLDIRLKQANNAEYIRIMLIDNDHLVMGGFPGSVPPWRFERVQQLPKLDLFKDRERANLTQPKK